MDLAADKMKLRTKIKSERFASGRFSVLCMFIGAHGSLAITIIIIHFKTDNCQMLGNHYLISDSINALSAATEQ